MKGCELCGRVAARVMCESDQASLCWECDAHVHGANFLVARHSRQLLCTRCQSPTPWRAEGPRLGPTVSLCGRCDGTSRESPEVGAVKAKEEEEESYDDDGGEGDDDDDDEEEKSDAGGEEEEDADNQVVPWAAAASSASSRTGGGFLKRKRENGDVWV